MTIESPITVRQLIAILSALPAETQDGQVYTDGTTLGAIELHNDGITLHEAEYGGLEECFLCEKALEIRDFILQPHDCTPVIPF